MEFIDKQWTISLPISNIASLGCYFSLEEYEDGLFEFLGISYKKSLHKAVKKRKAEYLAGRFLSKELLNQAGLKDHSVGTGDFGEPIWPDSITGSISHCDNIAVAVVMEKKYSYSIGIDIEAFMSKETASNIGKQLLFSNEKNTISQWEIPYNHALTLVFSLKESFFKAAFPFVNYYFGFDAIEVTDKQLRGDGMISFSLNKELCKELNEEVRCKAYYKFLNKSHILTFVSINNQKIF